MTIEISRSELEELIRQRMVDGGFQDVEEALLQALKSSTAPPRSDRPKAAKKSLAQFLLESPLRDSGLILERQQDYPEPCDL